MLKNVKVCLITIAFMLVSMLGLSSVNAADVDGIVCKLANNPGFASDDLQRKYFVLNSISSPQIDGFFSALSSNGHAIYCTERGFHTVTGSGPNYVSSERDASSDLVAKALVYGAKYQISSPSCAWEYLGTQMVVWMAQKQVSDGGFDLMNENSVNLATLKGILTGTGSDAVAEYAYGIIKNMRNHNVIPSFAYATKDAAIKADSKLLLKYDTNNYYYKTTVTDSKAVLDSYTLGTNPTGVTATKSANTLTIISKNENETTPIGMHKKFYDKVLVATRTSGDVQSTSYVEKYTEKTVDAFVPYEYEKINKGIVEIIKTDKYTKNKMENVSFGIYSDDKCTVKAKDYLGKEQVDKKTDKNGKITWTDLYMPLENGKYKTYYVKEAIPEGYVQDSKELQKQGAKDGCIPVQAEATVPNKAKTQETDTNKKTTASLEVNNIPYGNITIQKTDSVTKKVIEGVEFKLSVKNGNKTEVAKDIKGKEVKNAVTDKRGIAEFKDIPYGDYIIEEIKAGDWYKILEKPLEFTLNKDSDALKYKAQGTEAIPSKGDVLIPSEKYLLGDPNDDGKIDNDDIKIIDSIIAMQIEETEKQFYAADVNKDNVVDSKDKELLQKYINGDTTAIPDALKEFEVSNYQKRVSLSVTNVPLDMKISKVSITNEKELPGAKIVIKNSKGEVFIEYTSTKKQKEFYIPIGDYTLIETVAPKGYQKLKTEVKFRVLANGNIKMISATSSTHKLVKSQDGDLDHLKIFNSPEKISVPNTGSVIAISTLVIGIGLIGGGAYVLYRKYKMN